MHILINSFTDIKDIVEEFSEFMSKMLPSSIVPVIIQLVATCVIFIVVAKFAYLPVRKILRERQEYIANQVKDAEVSKEKALEYEAIAKGSINEAKIKSEEMIKDAKAQIEKTHENAINELNEEIKARKQRVEEEIKQEKEAAVEEVRKQIIDVALQASEVVLNREVNKDDNARLVEDFVKDIVN